jgi:acetylglutamate kinase
LAEADLRHLVDSGVATGGMRAKLEAAAAALVAGVTEVRIAPGTAPDILARVLAGEQAGTRVAAREEAVR